MLVYRFHSADKDTVNWLEKAIKALANEIKRTWKETVSFHN